MFKKLLLMFMVMGLVNVSLANSTDYKTMEPGAVKLFYMCKDRDQLDQRYCAMYATGEGIVGYEDPYGSISIMEWFLDDDFTQDPEIMAKNYYKFRQELIKERGKGSDIEWLNNVCIVSAQVYFMMYGKQHGIDYPDNVIENYAVGACLYGSNPN